VSRDGRVAQLVRPVRGAGSLGVVIAQDSWLDLTWLQRLFPLGVLGSGVLAVLIATGLARATTSPLEELGRGASRVADGDLSTAIEVRSRDEVGELATAFNRMTEKVRGQVEALEDSGRQLRAGVARLGDALGGTHDLDRILAVVLETAIAATGARAGAVLLRDDGSGELRLSAGRSLEERGVPSGLRVPADVGITGAVARSGRPVRGRSGTGRGDLRPGPGEPSGAPVVAVPLTGSGTVVGVLLLWDRDDDGDFTEDDLAVLRTFTSQATVAVDNVLLHEEARRLSVTDGLTGLANYRGFTVTVGKEVERAVRFERPLALLLLDLDHFKLVNDVWGHPRGDAVLVELAARVRGQVRDVDTLARYGGEEFVVVLPETDRDGAVQAAERICAAVRRRPFGEDGEQPIDVTLSLGIAVFPEHGTSSTALLRRADEALYAAKRGGRDRWRLASPQTAGGAATGSAPSAVRGGPGGAS
jgi:diguanylate cyclase (GGDEF)-like protein